MENNRDERDEIKIKEKHTLLYTQSPIAYNSQLLYFIMYA